jgi:pimeloyl-ACP methyl ester carboxylesterase
MATYVLLHGGWGGGWEWREVGDRLTAAGHRVFRPSLTGLGDRRHLARKDVDLNTHIQDVLALLDTEDLDHVVLCGQSYSGMVISGVGNREPDRIDRLVFVDGFVPDDGESLMDLIPEWLKVRLRELAEESGEGWLVPLPFPIPEPGEAPPEVVAYFAKVSTPMPIGCFEQPLSLTSAINSLPTTYIRCTQIEGEDMLGPSARRASERGWEVRKLDSPHDAQFFAPGPLTQMLLEP